MQFSAIRWARPMIENSPRPTPAPVLRFDHSYLDKSFPRLLWESVSGFFVQT
jgi:hypothetical protein